MTLEARNSASKVMITNQGGRAGLRQQPAPGTAAGGGRGVQRGSCKDTAGDNARGLGEERHG
jgi:hypothetical protein